MEKRVTTFSFIKTLQKQEIEPEKVDSGIKYQQYDIVVEASPRSVLIPIRECQSFEKVMLEHSDLTSREIRKILRQFRGIYKRD